MTVDNLETTPTPAPAARYSELARANVRVQSHHGTPLRGLMSTSMQFI
jgi:hypothetical protein